VQQVGLSGRWKRSQESDLGQTKPPFVALLHQPAKRYVLVKWLNETWVVADDPFAGRVVYPKDRFLQAWLEAGQGQVFVLWKAEPR
jgi:hypothetical protein